MNNEPRKSIQDKAKPRPARNPARPALPASEPDRQPRDQPCIFMELTSRSSPSPQPRESTTATLKQPSTQGINLPQAQPRQLTSRMPQHAEPTSRESTDQRQAARIPPAQGTNPPSITAQKYGQADAQRPRNNNHRAGNTAGNRNTPHTGINRRACTGNTINP